MNPLSQPVRCHSGVTSVSAVLSLLLALCGCLAAGCGSAGMPSVTVPPPAAPPTSVTVVVSSTANDQFTSFYVDITSISLTNQAGTMVSVLAAPPSKAFTQTQEAEFIHLNGQMAPFLTAMVPQNVLIGLDAGDLHLNLSDAGTNAIHIEHEGVRSQPNRSVRATMSNRP